MTKKINADGFIVDMTDQEEAQLLIDQGNQLPIVFQNEISDRQFFQQLAVDGDITQDEALDAVTTGKIPQALLAVISGLPADEQFNAKMLISGATKFDYNNPLTAVLAQAMKRTDDQMRSIWTKAAAL